MNTNVDFEDHSSDHQRAALQAYSTRELSSLYKISRRHMLNWLNLIREEVGNKNGHLYNPKQVQIIFAEFGWPLVS